MTVSPVCPVCGDDLGWCPAVCEACREPLAGRRSFGRMHLDCVRRLLDADERV